MTKIINAVIFFIGVLFVSINADCDSEENFNQCIQYITYNKSVNCKPDDSECICKWDSQLVTCYSVCPDDENKAKEFSAASDAAKASCAKFKKEMDAKPKPSNGTNTIVATTPTNSDFNTFETNTGAAGKTNKKVGTLEKSSSNTISASIGFTAAIFVVAISAIYC
ncbi:hypothetical protein BB559_000281 [Furculomyces boomerangus]|uniref:Extracellular membrane protein CFEM domain-containing protein n=2 Tax=Harpellales TaxID=61421 RepID=A0A2T9Z5S7_9FUNG|nr:hypothetical protein BB559_000281 [Furculomyces boomerangus]PWA02032.1 hypothetical protein BB558_001832 [Smittium angustum]